MKSSAGNLQRYKDYNFEKKSNIDNKYSKEKRTKQQNVKTAKGKIDFILFIVVIFLISFGIIMIYSASSYHAQVTYNNSAYILKKQVTWTIFGLGAMFATSRINYHVYERFIILIYLIAVALQGIVLVIGREINGSKRWIEFGPVRLQPSELTKLVIIIFMACFVSRKLKSLNKYVNFLLCMGLAGVPVVLIAAENLSTAIVVIGIATAIIFVASPKFWHLLTLVVPVALFGVIFLKFFQYRLDRIKIWRNPWIDPLNKGFQTIQSLYAIGSGGLFGKGIGLSLQKLGFIPESHNDIIFSIVCEELGLCGASILIITFAILIWRCMVIASHSPDLYGSLITVGVMAHIAIQVIINIAVVTNTIPNTGMPLPFISYGGSSLVFLLMEMGIVLNVSKHIRKGYDGY